MQRLLIFLKCAIVTRGSVAVVFLLLSKLALAQKTYDFNTNCRLAYKEIIQLKLNNGQRLLDAEKIANPNNLIPYFLENYIDFFTLFFNEDPKEYKKREGNLAIRLEKMSDGPESSPFFLFTKSIIHFQWAAVKVKFGHKWDAGWEFRRSFLQVKENQSEHAQFYPNELYRGTMQVSAGSIPDGYRWLSNLLGIKGSITGGMNTLRGFLERKDDWSVLFHDEAIFYFCYLKYYVENDKNGVFGFIKEQQLDLVNNHLFTYLAANLSLNSQQAENCKKIITGRNPSTDYLVTPVWDMELGYAKLHHLEPDAAGYLDRFIEQFKGTSYVKDVLQKLSWNAYLNGDQAAADNYRAAILKKGTDDTEADKQALKEAKTTLWPNKLLLRARLLNDGGYYMEALRLLQGKRYTDFKLPQEQAEFAYRAARIYDDLGNEEVAINFYKEAIAVGEKRTEFFAAKAALHIGNIYEKRNEKTTAITWYRRCMAMGDHDYKNSLDQRAKAGIARCKGE